MQLLCHVTSSPRDADVKGDILRRAIMPSKTHCHSFDILGVTGGGGADSHPNAPPPLVVEEQKKPV